MKAYRASAKDAGITRDTPRAAALAFFEAHPERRKCDVHEGETDGAFFTLKLSLLATGKGTRWKDITRKSVDTLPHDMEIVP